MLHFIRNENKVKITANSPPFRNSIDQFVGRCLGMKSPYLSCFLRKLICKIQTNASPPSINPFSHVYFACAHTTLILERHDFLMMTSSELDLCIFYHYFPVLREALSKGGSYKCRSTCMYK